MTKVKRNDLCPCGSGKKYKKCHMDKPLIYILGSKKFLITAEIHGERFKLFQMFYGNDGTLFIDFPFYKNSNGIASKVILSPSLPQPANISLTENGKITSHLVKFSHHPDGRCHFSQDGKIRTEIKNQGLPHSEIKGHMFTVTIQGVDGFQKAIKSQDITHCDSKKCTLKFDVNNVKTNTIKFIGWWYPIEYVEKEYANKKITSQNKKMKNGPQMSFQRNDGKFISGFLLSVANTNPSNKYILFLSAEPIPTVSKDHDSGIIFIGAFSNTKVKNLNPSTSFLALSYPALHPEETRKLVGSIDLELKPI